MADLMQEICAIVWDSLVPLTQEESLGSESWKPHSAGEAGMGKQKIW